MSGFLATVLTGRLSSQAAGAAPTAALTDEQQKVADDDVSDTESESSDGHDHFPTFAAAVHAI